MQTKKFDVESTVLLWAGTYTSPSVQRTDRIRNGSTVVTTTRTLQFVIDYPLSKKFVFVRSRKNGWHLVDVVRMIRKIYAYIYAHDTKFGIWGHDIGDLVIEGIELRGTNITPSIGS